MQLNLGLTADAAAAHTNDLSVDPETPPAQSASSYPQAFSLASLPLLGTLYNKSKPADGSLNPPGVVSGVAMSPISSTEDGSSHELPIARPHVSTQANRKAVRTKTSYQLAHPAHHARHKRLKLRPKLLLQLQQVSQTPRPLPILDILPSTVYLPRLARKFPAMFRGKNGLGPNDLIIVMSELYERTVSSVPEQAKGADDGEDQREVVATICQMLQEEQRQKGKAEICLNFGPVWEATPLPSGSYEFVAHTDEGLRVMRWALRGGKNRRASAPQGVQAGDDPRRFTFSLIDPTTRRHPVIASMTRNQLEVFDEYSTTVRTSTGHTTPSSNMSVVSDLSDDTPADANLVTLDDELRTLIIITGIWVAFREGWSHNFSYGDPISKSPTSPASSKTCSFPGNAKSENISPTDHDGLASLQKNIKDIHQSSAASNPRRSSTAATLALNEGKAYGSLARRSNSTGAAFMDKVKRRSASAAIGNKPNRHSMLSGGADSGRELVVPRPQSTRQNSIKSEEAARGPKNKPQPQTQSLQAADKAKPQGISKSNRPQALRDTHLAWEEDDLKTSQVLNGNGKSKRRHRLSSMFTMFHRKQEAH